MGIYFKPAMRVVTTTWRDPETGKVSHFEHEVELDPRARPILVEDLADLRKKLGSQNVVCETQADGRTYVFARDLAWDGALGEYPPVLGQLQVVDIEEILNSTLWQGDHS